MSRRAIGGNRDRPTPRPVAVTPLAPGLCAVCGRTLTSRRPQRVCSPRCRIAAGGRRAPRRPPRRSPGCTSRTPTSTSVWANSSSGRGTQGPPPGAAASPVTLRPGSVPAGCGRAGYRRSSGGTREQSARAPAQARPGRTPPGSGTRPRLHQKIFAVGRVDFRRAPPDILAKLLWTIPTFPPPRTAGWNTLRLPPGSHGASSGQGQDPRTACSRQERGVDVSSDSSEPPTGSPHRLQGEPRPESPIWRPRPGRGRVGAPCPMERPGRRAVAATRVP